MRRAVLQVACAAAMLVAAAADASSPDPARDILVTIEDESAAQVGTGISAPYRMRKRYATEADTLRVAEALADDYQLVEIDRWPIRSLAVLCIVFRPDEGESRNDVLERLGNDARIASAQSLQEFETMLAEDSGYDDTYMSLQRALTLMDIPAAHRHTRGGGVRVAIVDSHADVEHEDLAGRVRKQRSLLGTSAVPHAGHGTAVASVIGATANNALGIVGIAPDAALEIYVACRAEEGRSEAICDSFTLAKALDEIVASRPDVLNLSLAGPHDPLLTELLAAADRAGIIAVAARGRAVRDGHRFPASLPRVIGVASSDVGDEAQVPSSPAEAAPAAGIFAPGMQIMVALPSNEYDFRSGNSLAAAHVSGVVALLMSVQPGLTFDALLGHLRTAQGGHRPHRPALNACAALRRIDPERFCALPAMAASEGELDAERQP